MVCIIFKTFWWVFLQIKSCLSLLPYMRPGNTLKIVSWGDNRAHWFPVSEGLGSSIAWFSLSSKHYFTYFCMILLFWGRRVNFILLFTSLWESESQILKYSYEKILELIYIYFKVSFEIQLILHVINVENYIFLCFTFEIRTTLIAINWH